MVLASLAHRLRTTALAARAASQRRHNEHVLTLLKPHEAAMISAAAKGRFGLLIPNSASADIVDGKDYEGFRFHQWSDGNYVVYWNEEK